MKNAERANELLKDTINNIQEENKLLELKVKTETE